MKYLHDSGAGFDCASGMELEKANSLFNSRDQFSDGTIFANPCKPPRDLRTAQKLGSGSTVIDSIEELEKLNSVKWSQGSLIRIAVEDAGSKMPFSKKFGANVQSVSKIADAAKALGQEICGISFHVGSGCYDPTQYTKAIQLALLSLPKTNNLYTIDIGGGFDAHPREFIKAARSIRETIQSVSNLVKVKWIAEPGRFMATEFQDLFVPVIGKKPGANGEGWRYTIDESLYGQFSCIPFDRAEPRWLRIAGPNEKRQRTVGKGVLFGRTCDSVDMIAKSEKMEELEVGDWLWFPHMGAYTSVTATEFNGFPKPEVHYVEESIPSPIFYNGPSNLWPQKLSTVSHVLTPKD
jgi:ornithine decarboxylase